MKNTETADVFAGMPKSRVLKMWWLYRRETEALLRQSVPNWILQENRDLLRNFFHSRQDGGTGFRMAAWTSACRKLEEHLLAGGQIALLTSRLLELQNLFEEEASSVDRRLAEKRND